MRTLITVIVLSLVTSVGFGQSTSKYQVATITDVRPHATGSNASEIGTYDVSLKVGGTNYVVLYTPSLGESTIKYFAGRDLLVMIGKDTITYNDILGRSFEVPIQSHNSIPSSKQSK